MLYAFNHLDAVVEKSAEVRHVCAEGVDRDVVVASQVGDVAGFVELNESRGHRVDRARFGADHERGRHAQSDSVGVWLDGVALQDDDKYVDPDVRPLTERLSAGLDADSGRIRR